MHRKWGTVKKRSSLYSCHSFAESSLEAFSVNMEIHATVLHCHVINFVMRPAGPPELSCLLIIASDRKTFLGHTSSLDGETAKAGRRTRSKENKMTRPQIRTND